MTHARTPTFAMYMRLCIVSAIALFGAAHAAAQGAPATDEPLPGRIVINVDSPERALYRIAVPDLLGAGALSTQGAEVIRSDLTLSSLFQVLDARSFIANLAAEDLGITKNAWSSV